jgi:hypothetical protein
MRAPRRLCKTLPGMARAIKGTAVGARWSYTLKETSRTQKHTAYTTYTQQHRPAPSPAPPSTGSFHTGCNIQSLAHHGW